MSQNSQDVYRRLAAFLDDLPAGFPPTESGVELRLLAHLFTEEEAALALHLNLISEPLGAIARRTGLPEGQAAALLAEMARKGLISVDGPDWDPPRYAASQFVIGFWEGQVGRLDDEVVALFEAYAPVWFDRGPWKKLPQVRTIPIHESIPITSEVLPYEAALEILRAKNRIAVRPCICRQEGEILGEGCGKPLEACLSFDGAAEATAASGAGRLVTFEEAAAILNRARAAGLVLQPANARDPLFMCACCDCCCGVLRSIKKEPNPGSLVANPFVARFNPEACIGCGQCLAVCPMDALHADGEGVAFDAARCIGCGLCVSVCPWGAVEMTRRAKKAQPRIPATTAGTYLRLAQKRGGRHLLRMVWMAVKSYLARLGAALRR
jgi:Na+-translocating ferredoxin:NAD+ oxidoreductase subunit B